MEKTVMPYGDAPVYLCMTLPMQRCLECSLLFSGEAAERAQEDAIALYRAQLCVRPNAASWCERNAAMLGILSPIDVVLAWEEHCSRFMPRKLPPGPVEPPKPPSARSKSQLRRFKIMGASQFCCEFCGTVVDISSVLKS